MEDIIWFLMVIAYIDISSKLSKIINNQKSTKKDFSILKSLINKQVEIKIKDDYQLVLGYKRNGTLKEFNDKWIVMECSTKKGKETNYYRIQNIESIEEKNQ